MKTLAFLAALSLSTVALAQQAGTPPAGTTAEPQKGMGTTQADTAQPGMEGSMSTQGSTTGTPDSMTPPAPAAPAGDAMATPNASDPSMTPPAGDAAAGTPGGSGSMGAATTASSDTLPTCSRTVKDKCRNRGGK